MTGKSLRNIDHFDDLCPQAEPATASVRRWRSQDQLEFDTEFYLRILEQSPKSTDILRIIGELLSHRGQHQAALAVDMRLAELCPKDCVVHYNLACSLAQLGKQREAVKELQRAFDYGYSDVEHMERDPDLAPLRCSSAYQSLVDELTAASGEFYLEIDLEDLKED
ncbi:MAG: tetratricopeptide repeat protein [Pirellulales bacterium]|nr:tetratricopeptide repeat protein [Pirellulales bacterium]